MLCDYSTMVRIVLFSACPNVHKIGIKKESIGFIRRLGRSFSSHEITWQAKELLYLFLSCTVYPSLSLFISAWSKKRRSSRSSYELQIGCLVPEYETFCLRMAKQVNICQKLQRRANSPTTLLMNNK